jgi:predicted RecB family nuclease
MFYESESGNLKFSPSDLTVFLETEFASWMDRWHIEHWKGHQKVTSEDGLPIGLTLPGSEECAPNEKDEQLELLAAKGLEHEEAFLERLRADGHEIAEFDVNSNGVVDTLEAMRQQKDIIFQAPLQHEIFAGIADFLALKPGASLLGDHHYEVWDTKLARSTKASFVVQLCAYAEMLEHLQGRRPEGFEVVLGNNDHVRFLTNRFIYYFRELKRSFLEFHDDFDPHIFPHPGMSKSFGRWSTFAKQVLEESDHLSGVANVTRSQIRKLEEAGITTLTELSTSTLDYVPKLPQPTLQRLQAQARLQCESKGKDRPLYNIQAADEMNPRRGLALLPPSSEMDVYFDIEGFPLRDDGLEYLLGAVHIVNGDPQFVDWWAHDDAQEKKAFEGFVDWAHARWQSDPTMHIYHYAAYEVRAMRELMGKYATREREVDNLLRHQVFVDLYTVVRQGLIVGTPSYSLKDIERLYMDVRDGEVTTAGGSVVAYHRWLESGESEDWHDSAILKEIRDYNEVDCVSTWELAEWLRNVQSQSDINYVAPDADENASDSSDPMAIVHPATQLAKHLIAHVESGKIKDLETCRVQELLAWLLEFHWREDKPVFWRMFDWHEKTEQELIDDFDCLGGLCRTPKSPTPIKRSHLYEYSYAPDQDTKLHVDSRCYFAHDLAVKTTIHHLDTKRGLVEIKLGPSVDAAPDSLSLFPDEHVSSKTIAEAVLRYVEAWSQGDILSRAVDDLIHRRKPRVKGHKKGPLVSDEADILSESIDVISRMNRTVLCIQGPPGTGKTYTAAHAILQLLQDNKKVAVTANSHKAILNVLHAVHQAMQEADVDFPLVKVRGNDDDPLIQSGVIQYVPESNQAVNALGGGPLVMGGTAWVFCRPELQGEFDYLFVDEAGQFSLANVVATGLSADNIVLVGDQMQLAQPMLGAHPGDSGKSALEYLLGGHATIPPHFGIFLNQTWRMHPNICGFISEAVYEDRLHAHPKTSKQGVSVPADGSGVVDKEAGIVFVPVEHEGNTQGSQDEADVIEKIITELMGQTVSHFGGKKTTPLTLEDILIVAPFNMQVRLLQDRLGAQARVGSVDKFQGQEAHVVIVSMCSSTLEESPRGAEFLLDPNRINVAVSRARSLAIVVGSPDILRSRCQTIKEMELLNLYCWLVDHAGNPHLTGTERGSVRTLNQR